MQDVLDLRRFPPIIRLVLRFLRVAGAFVPAEELAAAFAFAEAFVDVFAALLFFLK